MSEKGHRQITVNGQGKAVFLDRDGTINRDVHFCRRPEAFQLLPLVGDGIRMLNQRGFKVIVITNQSGIGRGFFSQQALDAIHRKMKADLAQYGARVDAIYICPHLPEDQCDCRKPKTTLAEDAIQRFGIDPRRSFLVGDRAADVALGKALGCRVARFNSQPAGVPAPAAMEPDYASSNFMDVVQWIVQRESDH